MSGVHPKTIQTVMRHSTITLTMDTYGHLFKGQESAAVERMHDMLVGPPETLAATGTDDIAASPNEKSQRKRRRAGRGTRRQHADRCNTHEKNDADPESPKPLAIADLGDSVRDDATENASTPGRIRTSRGRNGENRRF